MGVLTAWQVRGDEADPRPGWEFGWGSRSNSVGYAAKHEQGCSTASRVSISG